MVPKPELDTALYTVQIRADDAKHIICSGFCPIYGSNPFGTRTHILSNCNSNVKVNSKPLTVLKDQMCQAKTRFDEYQILTRVHGPEKVPGVVEAVYHEVIATPFCESREKHRMGLQQVGQPFLSIPTLRQALEMIFDILEGNSIIINHILCAHTSTVLRYLRFERLILHRDISKGNVVYVGHPSTSATSDAQSGGVNKTGETKEVSLCFIKYLLGERYVEKCYGFGHILM